MKHNPFYSSRLALAKVGADGYIVHMAMGKLVMLGIACIALLAACSKSDDSVKKTEAQPPAPAAAAEAAEPAQNIVAAPAETTPTSKRSVFAPLPTTPNNPVPAAAPVPTPTVSQSTTEEEAAQRSELYTQWLRQYITEEGKLPRSFRALMSRKMDEMPPVPSGKEWVINEKEKTVELRSVIKKR
ncbi:MAG: hypothetical protein WCO56_06040 [Verrucomicrobiota bacterium]